MPFKAFTTGLLLFVLSVVSGQSDLDIQYFKIESSSLYDSRQVIHILALKKTALSDHSIKIAYSDTLTRTSKFAIKHNAEAAINAGFFNVKEGFSVSFLEDQGKVIARTQNELDKRKNTNQTLNASLILDEDITIREETWDSVYMNSDAEKAVLGAGPLLLLAGKKVPFPETPFATNRHPRSCICETANSILFFVVDGRSSEAAGVNLFQLQDLLLAFHCLDAMNLDGGGSSTLWMREKGVVNTPSDITGERKVANALLIVREAH